MFKTLLTFVELYPIVINVFFVCLCILFIIKLYSKINLLNYKVKSKKIDKFIKYTKNKKIFKNRFFIFIWISDYNK